MKRKNNCIAYFAHSDLVAVTLDLVTTDCSQHLQHTMQANKRIVKERLQVQNTVANSNRIIVCIYIQCVCVNA